MYVQVRLEIRALERGAGLGTVAPFRWERTGPAAAAV